jgi:tetratricopeptide (TPR) repeat protein
MTLFAVLTACACASATPTQALKLRIETADSLFDDGQFSAANSIYNEVTGQIPCDDDVLNNSYVALLWRAGYTHFLLEQFGSAYDCFYAANRIIEGFRMPSLNVQEIDKAARFFSLKEKKLYVGEEKEKMLSYACAAYCALRTDSLDRAEIELKRALRISERYPLVTKLLGDVLWAKGDPSGALAMYKRTAALNPKLGRLPRALEAETLPGCTKTRLSVFSLPFQPKTALRRRSVLYDENVVNQASADSTCVFVVLDDLSLSKSSGGLLTAAGREGKDVASWFGHELLTFYIPIGVTAVLAAAGVPVWLWLGGGAVIGVTSNVVFGTSDMAKSGCLVLGFAGDVAKAMGRSSSQKSSKDDESFLKDAMNLVGGHEDYVARLQQWYRYPMRAGIFEAMVGPGVYYTYTGTGGNKRLPDQTLSGERNRWVLFAW